MIGVVDTSAVMRLFIPDGPIPEGLTTFFRKVESGVDIAIAPELLLAEAANVVLKKTRRDELTDSEAKELLAFLEKLPIRYFPHRPLLRRAYSTAMETGLTAYDALFLGLAEDRGAVLFTADDKLSKAAASRGLLAGG